MVQVAQVDSRLSGDVTRGRLPEALLQKEPLRDIEYPFTCVCLERLHREQRSFFRRKGTLFPLSGQSPFLAILHFARFSCPEAC